MALAALLAGPASAESPWSFELAGQQEWQRWRETGSDGRRLVSEDGRLSGVAAGLGWTPPEGDVSLALRAGLLYGERDYDGLSSRGAAVQSRSDIRNAFIGLETALAARPLLASWQWRPRAAVELWQWRRRLNDVGTVSGYPERYRQGLLLLGVQVQGDSGWRARLDAGGGPGGRNRLQLPGRDVASLPLGTARVWRLGFGAELAPAWRWDVMHENLTLGAGDERAITLQGVPLQAARQPRTTQRRLQLQLSWRR